MDLDVSHAGKIGRRWRRDLRGRCATTGSKYGITDGPAYQDLTTDGAALFHIRVEDVDTAMQWFRSDTFKDASKLAKVTGRRFYLAQPQSN